MASIWDEKTFWKKVKYQDKKILKREIPSFLMILLILYFIFEKISIVDLLLLSSSITLWIFSTINIFLQPPHPNIPDDYSKGEKTLMFVGMWIMGSIILIFIGNMIFNKYYA